jgi:antitoxin component YwqK of YwqJK toxin-antitoxin module
MKAVLMVLVMVLFGVSVFAQNYKLDQDVRYNPKTKLYLDNSGKPVTGHVELIGEKNKTRLEFDLVDGKKNGLEKDHLFQKETPYKNGIKTGTEKHYYNSGKLHYEVFIANGEYTGVVKAYHENGKLDYEIPQKKPSSVPSIKEENIRSFNRNI